MYFYIVNETGNTLKVLKMLELETNFEKLNKTEAKTLHQLLRERHGNIKACAKLTGLSVNTLKRAAGQLDIVSDNARIIREKLLVEQLENA